MYGFCVKDNPMDAVALCIVKGSDEQVCYIGRDGITADLWGLLLGGDDEDEGLGLKAEYR